jgi:hypothetical protein
VFSTENFTGSSIGSVLISMFSSSLLIPDIYKKKFTWMINNHLKWCTKTHTMDNILNSHVSCRLHHTILLLNRQIHRPLQGYNTLVVVDDPLSRLCGTQHVTQNVSSFPEHLQSKYHFTWDANLKFSKKLAEHHFLFFYPSTG